MTMGLTETGWRSDKRKTGHKLTRIKSVYFYIKKHGPVSTKELVEEFEMSYRTIERDLDILLYNGLIIHHNSTRGRWVVTNKKVKGESHD